MSWPDPNSTATDTEMIPSHLHYVLAQAQEDDLRRAAAARKLPQRQAQQARALAPERSMTLRFSSPADERLLAWLAALDSSRPPAQPVLLAEVDGQPLAALTRSDGTGIADPFHQTADLIDLLRARARPLNGTTQAGRSGRLRAWSRLRAPAWR
jgi:hypothetical protein